MTDTSLCSILLCECYLSVMNRMGKTLAQAGQVEEIEEVKAEVDTTKVGE